MRTFATLGVRHGHWLFLGMMGAAAVVAACSTSLDIGAGEADATGSDSGRGTGTAEPPEPNSESTGDGGEVVLPTVPDAGRAEEGTNANLRVAFIGDTAAGPDFRKVLQLIKAEKAELVVIQGDLTYDGDNGADWFPVIDGEINKAAPGSAAPVTIPYVVSKGNHDTDWNNIGAGLKTRLGQWGIPADHNDPTTRNYSVVYKGLKLVMVDQAETSPSRADYVKARLEDDKHQWKICSWHKNMRATNVANKNNEMPWAVYEACRSFGAIVAQGHSHTYSRSKTITNDTAQTVDATCTDPFSLCVGPGKHFFFDSSLGGHDMRDLNSTISAKPYWGSVFNGSFGALFIDFNVDGNPKKARGYFKTIGGTIVDPPASSGKTSFEITSTN